MSLHQSFVAEGNSEYMQLNKLSGSAKCLKFWTEEFSNERCSATLCFAFGLCNNSWQWMKSTLAVGSGTRFLKQRETETWSWSDPCKVTHPSQEQSEVLCQQVIPPVEKGEASKVNVNIKKHFIQRSSNLRTWNSEIFGVFTELCC